MSQTRMILKLVFSINVLFLLLLAFSYPFIEPGSGAHVAAVMTLVPIVLMFVLVGVLLYTDANVLDF